MRIYARNAYQEVDTLPLLSTSGDSFSSLAYRRLALTGRLLAHFRTRLMNKNSKKYRFHFAIKEICCNFAADRTTTLYT